MSGNPFGTKHIFIFVVFIMLIFIVNKIIYDRITNSNIFHIESNVKHNLKVPRIDNDTAKNDILKVWLNNFSRMKENVHIKNESLKYILLWTDPKSDPFVYLEHGQSKFISRKCQFTNCYVTSERNFFGDITLFDVVAFAGPQFKRATRISWPDIRSTRQKYVFASVESSHNYPVCNSKVDGFFNWTWTYKLDSDSRWGYIVVRDKNGTIIGPKKEMHWVPQGDMLPVPEDLKHKLANKTKLAAWFVSNCKTAHSHARMKYVKELQTSLIKYNKTVDIYGKCGTLNCTHDNEKQCHDMIRNDYYFYLALENSFSEDYVTEKVLKGLNNNAIPVVYGGANYSRFLPPGSYLNANEMPPEKMAETMVSLVLNFEQYVDYFRWTNHYTFHRQSASPETDEYCGMCALLNDKSKTSQSTVYKNFTSWWNPRSIKCEPFISPNFEDRFRNYFRRLNLKYPFMQKRARPWTNNFTYVIPRDPIQGMFLEN